MHIWKIFTCIQPFMEINASFAFLLISLCQDRTSANFSLVDPSGVPPSRGMEVTYFQVALLIMEIMF
jgi:hypothetical protein